MRVADTKARWRRAEFQWGRTDCILSVCDHVLRATGIDPALPWRCRYSTEAAARALMEPYGGVLGIMRHGMALAGFGEGEPLDGRPVVALVDGQETAGVMFGNRVGFMADRGLVEMRAPILTAWVI